MVEKPQQPDPQEPKSPQQDRLIEQARVAADQAIELAKLAQESAKLARDLNRRARGETGRELQGLPEVTLRTEPATPESGRRARRDRIDDSIIEEPGTQVPLGPVVSRGAAGASTGGQILAPQKLKLRRRRNSREALKERVARARRQQIKGGVPKRVKIKVQKGDLDREEGVVPFVKQNWNSMTISGCIIAVVMFLLTFYIMPVIAEDKINTVIASFADEPAIVEEDIPIEEPEEEPG
jgi:hypothetical protein